MGFKYHTPNVRSVPELELHVSGGSVSVLPRADVLRPYKTNLCIVPVTLFPRANDIPLKSISHWPDAELPRDAGFLQPFDLLHVQETLAAAQVTCLVRGGVL